MVKLKKTWLAVIAVLLGWGLLAVIATDRKPAAPQSPVDAGGFNAVTQAVARAGVRDCLPRIDQVTNFINTQSQSGAFLFVAPQQPDAALNSVSLELQTPMGLSYASTSFAPVGRDGCDALYEAVVYWENTCAEVATQGFADLKPAGAVREHIAILAGGPSLRVFLMPAGSGCISVKKELIH
jgi:hypothetical protein